VFTKVRQPASRECSLLHSRKARILRSIARLGPGSAEDGKEEKLNDNATHFRKASTKFWKFELVRGQFHHRNRNDEIQ
jgi:hypothetical protein